MEKYKVTEKTVLKIAECFSSMEESGEFFGDLDQFVEEMAFLTQFRRKTNEIDALKTLIKQTCAFILFCRDRIDLIHQLISSFDCEIMTKEELKELEDA